MSEGSSITDDRPQAVGFGRLVLVVGPSGVGKDTLIGLVRDQCRNDSDILFPVRTVTRESSKHEDNRAVTSDQFAREDASGAFVVAWQAHGHSYGISRDTDRELAAGRTVVLNVSRTVVELLRARYAKVTVVQVSAPAEVLASRLEARARSSDGDLAVRAAREHGMAYVKPDVVIDNVGTSEAGAAKLLAIVRGDWNGA